MRGIFIALAVSAVACGGARLTEVQRVKSGQLDVVLLSPHDAIRHDHDSFIIEFRAADGALVDVGDVKATATMPMPGAPMFGTFEVTKSGTAGRYDVDAKFDMAGTWRTTIEWGTSVPRQSASFSSSIQ